MKMGQILPAWAMILKGRRPFLSIEVTRVCPLRCPGCYAYAPNHISEDRSLRNSSGFGGPDLIDRVVALVQKYRPLHVSLVGGEPLVRYKELNDLLPVLAPVEVQIATSAVYRVPPSWAGYDHVHIVVSVDGLPEEHDKRRAPATYDRILSNIGGHQVIVHCTITSQMMLRSGYLADFAAFWSAQAECRKIWFSLFTPQVDEFPEERLTQAGRQMALRELASLSARFPKVYAPDALLDRYAHPPQNPGECIFACITTSISPDLKTEIRPCQLGGMPECSQCGCMASAGFEAIGRHRLAGMVKVSDVFRLSARIGDSYRRLGLSKAGLQRL